MYIIRITKNYSLLLITLYRQKTHKLRKAGSNNGKEIITEMYNSIYYDIEGMEADLKELYEITICKILDGKERHSFDEKKQLSNDKHHYMYI